MNTLFAIACAQILGIKKPVEIRMRIYGKGKTKTLAGFCETRFRKGIVAGFVVYINLDSCAQSEYNLEDVIAHELVHAIMIQESIFNEKKHHCEIFQKICKQLESDLNKAGFVVGRLYNPLTDTD